MLKQCYDKGDILEYIWLDSNSNFRSKIRVLTSYQYIEQWNYDGSSTGQAKGNDSEIVLNPVFVCNNPFFRNGYIVLCDTYKKNEPLSNNYRLKAKEIFDKYLDEKPWFGLEQEYFMFQNNKNLGSEQKQGNHYCGVGCNKTFGRFLAEKHMKYCILAGLKISGINAEVGPGQWEYQIGPVEGLEASDQLLVSRYLLIKLAEENNIEINLEPKPIKGDYNGSGCHINFSTHNMRQDNGYDIILKAVKKLSLKHKEHMDVYGENNKERMTGKHETASYDEFNFGLGNRGCSIRIGENVIKSKKGYFEDRRPASNIDPYLATSKLLETCCE